MKVFGIKATVYIEFKGNLRDLGDKLCKCLYLNSFHFDTDEEAPHEEFGSTESLGTEIWLRKSTSIEGYNFIIELKSENCIQEEFNNQMHDMSPWLAKYISEICSLRTYIKAD